jgi:hypothetical protein
VLLCLADPGADTDPAAGHALLLAVTLCGPGRDDPNVATNRWLNLSNFEVAVDEIDQVGTHAIGDLPVEALGWPERAFAAARAARPERGEVRAWLLQLPRDRRPQQPGDWSKAPRATADRQRFSTPPPP